MSESGQVGTGRSGGGGRARAGRSAAGKGPAQREAREADAVRPPPPPRLEGPRLTLDDLAARGFAELDALYGRGLLPESLRALDGPLVGRMLAVRGVGGAPADALRRFAAAAGFPWAGKSFTAAGDREGQGINRVRLPGPLGTRDLFPFHTRIARSAFDAGEAVLIDYERPENPAVIRRIHDEVREVSPGLFLGPAMWKRAGGAVTVLWFALQVPSS